MSDKWAVFMHNTGDSPMRMVVGYKFRDTDKLPKPIREVVFRALGVDDEDEDGIVELASEACYYIRPIDIGKHTDKFTLTVIYDNANFHTWIGVDLGYELVHTPKEEALYEESGALDPEKVIQIITDLDEFVKGTVLEQFGKPLLATLWCQ